jgi:hypothetical protein
MIIEVNLTQLIFIIIAVISAVWAVARLFYAQFESAQELRHKALLDRLNENQETTLQLERDFLKFQSEIPRTYMRRDDSMREVQELKETIQREMAPLRISVNRIEDFLIQK